MDLVRTRTLEFQLVLLNFQLVVLGFQLVTRNSCFTISLHTNTSYKDYLQDSVLNSFFLKPATKKEVISVINEMKTNKSTGPKSIPTYILKIRNQIICKPLTYLINLSFSDGTFPDLLKTLNVFPAFKRGENQDYNNYRPISLISNLSKLMEKIVHPRLYSSRFIPPEKRKRLVFDVIRMFSGGVERYQWHQMGKTLWKQSYFRKVFGPENYRKLYNFLLYQMWKYPISSGWPCRPLNP